MKMNHKSKPANLSHDDVVACAGCKSVRIPSYRISTALNKAQDAGGSWRGSFSTVATVLHNTIGEKSLQLLWETRRHPLPIPLDSRRAKTLILLQGITHQYSSSRLQLDTTQLHKLVMAMVVLSSRFIYRSLDLLQ